MKPIFLSITCLLLVFSACKKEPTDSSNVVLPAGPQDSITSFMIYLDDMVDSTTTIANYTDIDGPGPKRPTFGGFSLKKNRNYEVSFRIEDETGVPIVLNSKIKTNAKDYRICINEPLGITVSAKDSDGQHALGLVNSLTTSSQTGNDYMTFTIKYQKGVKNGQCDPGVVYFTCTLPFSVL
jgi:hypothetical protein